MNSNLKKLRYLELRYAQKPIWRETSLKTFFLKIRHLSPNNVLPPLKFINEIFCWGKSDSFYGNHLIWKPFRISVKNYKELTRNLSRYFGETNGNNGYKSFDQWFKAELLKRSKRKKIVELKVGSMIKLKYVPKEDIKTAIREKKKGLEDAGWTAKIIKEIIKTGKPVKIFQIDEFGNPWFSVILKVGQKREQHWLAILDNNSWDFVKK